MNTRAQTSAVSLQSERSPFLRVLLAGWLVVIGLLGGALGAVHFFSTVQQPLPEAPGDAWVVEHVLSGECKCSKRVVEVLARRAPRAGVSERVVLVEPSEAMAKPLVAAGFDVETLPADELEPRYGLSATPVLVVRRPDGRIAYSGGYGPRASAMPEVDTLLNDVLVERPRSVYPVFGCAVSKRLQQAIDPLSLKYGGSSR